MNISDEAVEAAAHAISECGTVADWEGQGRDFKEAMRREGRRAVEAAGPLLMTMALVEAAEAAEGMHDPVAPDCQEWADWLRARAATHRTIK
jgi:hypothetical protein